MVQLGIEYDIVSQVLMMVMMLRERPFGFYLGGGGGGGGGVGGGGGGGGWQEDVFGPGYFFHRQHNPVFICT